jgi:hypothetical protein
MRENLSAFILLVTHDSFSTSCFIAALRLKARIMIPHHAAFSPKSAEGSLPPEGVKKCDLAGLSLPVLQYYPRSQSAHSAVVRERAS